MLELFFRMTVNNLARMKTGPKSSKVFFFPQMMFSKDVHVSLDLVGRQINPLWIAVIRNLPVGFPRSATLDYCCCFNING